MLLSSVELIAPDLSFQGVPFLSSVKLGTQIGEGDLEGEGEREGARRGFRTNGI